MSSGTASYQSNSGGSATTFAPSYTLVMPTATRSYCKAVGHHIVDETSVSSAANSGLGGNVVAWAHTMSGSENSVTPGLGSGQNQF